MPLYNTLQTHPLAHAKVANQSPTVFAANVLLAESLLGLKAPAVTDEGAIERLELAIMLQVNFMAVQGIDPLIQEYAGSRHSGDQVGWRDRMIDPRAASIVADTLGALGVGAWKVNGAMTSHRTRDDGPQWPRRTLPDLHT